MRIILTAALLMTVAGCSEQAVATKPPVSAESTAANPVNSTLAETHRASDPSAPLDQPKSPADEDITASIRKKMMDTRMSPNLQNIHVSTQDGTVKLRGVVKTEEEKQKVEEIARTANGSKSVDSQIEVE